MAETFCRQRKIIGSETLALLFKRQRCTCLYCGDPISRFSVRGINYTVEHIIPYAVYKWCFHRLPEDEGQYLWEIINSVDNLAVACYTCNVDRNVDTLCPEDLQKLHLSDGLKMKYISVLDKCNKYTNMYKEMQKEVYERQKCPCIMCSSNIDLKYTTLRRIDGSKPRSIDNAFLLCKSCNFKYDRLDNLIKKD